MDKRIATGTVEGTGAVISINCGFVPRKVQLINIDGDAVLEWTSDMGAGKGYKILGTGLGALLASNGITASASTDTFFGFKIGADADINVATTGAVETIVWTAWPV